MQKLLLPLILLLTFFNGKAQNYNLSWGSEIKLKKGSTDLEIVAADETGLYFSEGKLGITKYKLIMADYGTIYRLIKYDHNYKEIYEKVYKKELKDLSFHSFQTLGTDLYMFATQYKDKNVTILGAKIDKSNGELTSDFIQVGRYNVADPDRFKLRILPTTDGAGFLVASDISTQAKFSMGIILTDNKLKKLEQSKAELDFKAGFYILEDMILTTKNQLVLLGREFKLVKKPGEQYADFVFKQFLLSVFSPKGEKERDLVIDGEGHHIMNGKLLREAGGEFVLAGFYSTAPDAKELAGFFRHRFDAEGGTVLNSSYKEIDMKRLGKKFTIEDEDDISGLDRRIMKAAERSGIVINSPTQLGIVSMELDPADQSIIVTAELQNHSYYQYSFMSSKGERKTHKIYKDRHFDIVVVNADKEGTLKWVNVIPKAHVERLSSSETEFSSYLNIASFFDEGNAFPFYSSFASLKRGKEFIIILNDHNDQLTMPKYGAQVTTVQNFRKQSSIFGITIDMATGKMTRKLIAANKDDVVLMPRHAFREGDQLIIPSWRMHSYAKTELKFARLAME